MSRPKLSFCIPTRNRAVFLERTVRFLLEEAGFPFPVEICISDNASVDETPSVVERFIAKGWPVRYKRNDTGVNMWTNHANALRQGRGEYLFAMSDDDLLATEPLLKIITFLDQNPGFVAGFAPVEYYDESTGTGGKYSYNLEKLPDITVLSLKEATATFDFFTQHVVPPELIVYRATAAQAIFNNTHFCYPCYFDVCGLLLQGDVAFFREAFYRWVTHSSVTDEVRAHAGVGESQSGWTQWRGGLEEMLNTLLLRAGLEVHGDGLDILDGVLDAFEMLRMEVTLGAHVKSREYLKAYEIFVQMRLRIKRRKYPIDNLKAYVACVEVLPQLLPWAYAAHLIRMEQNCDRVFLVGTPTPDEAKELLADQGVKAEVVFVPALAGFDADACAAPGKTRMIVVNNPVERKALLDASEYPAGQVLDLITLAHRFGL